MSKGFSIFHKVLDDPDIGRRELEIRKLVGLDPPGLPTLNGLGFPGLQAAQDEPKVNESVGVIVKFLPEAPDGDDRHVDLFLTLPHRAFFDGLPRLDLPAGEFPAVAHRRGFHPLGDEEFAVPLDDGGDGFDFLLHGSGLAARADSGKGRERKKGVQRRRHGVR